ncbi:MAG: cytochrome c [Vicinamibacterales bacterium]
MAQPRMLLFLFVAVLAVPSPAAPQLGPAAQPVPVLDNVDLMDLMIKPAYAGLQQQMAQPPTERQAWAALYQQSARLAELENLLFFRVRAPEGRQSEWADRAARARDASARVAAAALLGLRTARPGDFEQVRAAFPAIAQACTACHHAFAREAPTIKP